MKHVTTYHSPYWVTSRNTLAMIRNVGIEPTIIEYLKHPPSCETRVELVRRSGLGVRNILPEPQRVAFMKEDGEVIIDAEGKRA